MKTAALVLCMAVAASASPQFFFNRPGQATGSANANVVNGQTNGLGQNTQITSLTASAQGSTSGNGVSNNVASASNVGGSGIFGNVQSSNTFASSSQQSGFNGNGNNFNGFGGGFRPFRRPGRRGNRPFRPFNRFRG